MSFSALLTAIILFFLFAVRALSIPAIHAGTTKPTAPWWQIQSIDTMKYSRDEARIKLRDYSFDSVIDEQVRNIANAGATHVGIATPYDSEFLPILYRWVNAARKYNLKVWFRGNFSGWEQWFGYEKISRGDHLNNTREFINNNPRLFRSGDIFTPCPECENGGPGDPRRTGDTDGHRQFLIASFTTAKEAFDAIDSDVSVGYFSMNYDVAKLIMDEDTTKALGGIVTIDHYVATPQKLLSDIQTIAQTSGGRVFLGEFGAPIPDIHGKMSETDQFNWVNEVLRLLSTEPSLIGANYWVNVGGSTEAWRTDGQQKKVVDAIRNYYKPLYIASRIANKNNKPITNAKIISMYREVSSDASGQFIVPILSVDETIRIKIDNYVDKTIQAKDIPSNVPIIMERVNVTLIEKILDYINNILSIFS